MLLSTVFVIVPALMGVILLEGLWPRSHPHPSFMILKICLGVGIGLGLCSLMYFIWAVMGKPLEYGFVFIEVVFLSSLTAWYIYGRRDPTVPTGSDDNVTPELLIHWVLRFGFYVIVVGAMARFILLSLQNPHGYIDAWAIYNVKAKFLLDANPSWQNTFSELLASNPDYPLLISANVARGWQYMGETTVFVPILIAMTFTFITGGLLVSSVTLLRTSSSQGYLSGLILLGSASFIDIGVNQGADIPFAFFCLATIACFALYDRSDEPRGQFLFLAGLTAGLSTWTKNEGWLFLLAIIFARLLSAALCRRNSLFSRQLFSFALGLIPVIAIVFYFKIYLAPANDVVAGQEFQNLLTRLTDTSRHYQTGVRFVWEIWNFGGWPIPILFLLFFHRLCLGIQMEEWQKTTLLTDSITLFLVLFGYFLIYIITPHPLSWHLKSSMNRLLLHLWPSFLFLYFLIVRSPDAATEYVKRIEPNPA
jgi:Dolichyl-phosphate-mannose-protein mannosyltransferase